MLTWILAGYLTVSALTFFVIYSSYIMAARADQLQDLMSE